MADNGWRRKFEDPISLPGGRELITLRDVADYITSLPKKESDLPDWQLAIEALMLVSRGGPTMLARIAVMKALNRHTQKAPTAPRRKPAKAFGSFGDCEWPREAPGTARRRSIQWEIKKIGRNITAVKSVEIRNEIAPSLIHSTIASLLLKQVLSVPMMELQSKFFLSRNQ